MDEKESENYCRNKHDTWLIASRKITLNSVSVPDRIQGDINYV